MKSPRRKIAKYLAAALVAVLAVSGASWYVVRNIFQPSWNQLLTHAVQYEHLDLTVVERGTVESAENRDIVCRVKAGVRGGTNASSIKWVIEDGSDVKKGDLLVELDDSGLQEQLKTQRITLDQAKSAMIVAEEKYNIDVSQNYSEIQSAKVAIELADLDLKKYLHGEYEQTLKDVQSRLEMWRDRAAWSDRMAKKGYLSKSQALADRISLEKVQEELRVLEDYTKKRQETDLRNKLEEAKRALDRVEKQAKAKEIQADTEKQTKKSVYEQERDRTRELEGEIKKCTIKAPQNGLVVYFVPEQALFGGGSQQSIVAQGEPVREGQKLMRLPNLSRMVVNTKVHEAMVARVQTGQQAAVRVDSFPGQQLHAHVEQVATVAAQMDRMSADVKVYQTIITIEDPCAGLKPGMSAEVTIVVGDPLAHVLAIPVQAIIGSAELGKQRQCYVLTPSGPVKRDILVGQSNDRMAEIRSGLQEGERVVLNPRAVDDKAKVRTPGNGKRGRNGEDSLEEGNGKPGPNGGSERKEPKGGQKKKKKGPEGLPKNGLLDGQTLPDAPDAGQGAISSEDRQKMMKEMTERFRKATPAERKQMLEQIPEVFRERARETLKSQGIEVPD